MSIHKHMGGLRHGHLDLMLTQDKYLSQTVQAFISLVDHINLLIEPLSKENLNKKHY